MSSMVLATKKYGDNTDNFGCIINMEIKDRPVLRDVTQPRHYPRIEVSLVRCSCQGIHVGFD